MRDLEWPLNVIQDVLCWLWRQMRPRRQDCCAYRIPYINVPLSTIVKFDRYQNLRRHRTVLPAKARISCKVLAIVSRKSYRKMFLCAAIAPVECWSTAKLASWLDNLASAIHRFLTVLRWLKSSTSSVWLIEKTWGTSNSKPSVVIRLKILLCSFTTCAHIAAYG